MDTEVSARRVREFGRLPKIAGVQAVLAGILVLAGWQLDIAPLKSVFSGLVAMNPATAFGFIFSGVALLLLLREKPSPWAARVAALCSASVVLIAASRILGALSSWDPQLDRLLFPARLGADPLVPPNRMAPNTALNFLFVGAALLASQRATRAGLRTAQLLALASLLLSMLAVIGYGYGVRALYSVATYIPMALNTAIAFLLLSVGILFRRPGQGLTAVFIGDDGGGLMARRLLPLSLLILGLFGWLELRGRLAGLYDAPFGVSLHAAASIVVLTIVIWANAWSLRRAEAERNRATEALRRAHGALEGRVAERTRELSAANEELREEIAQRRRAEASLTKLTRAVEQTADLVVIADREGLIEYVNPAFERHTGFTLDELSGESLPALRSDLHDPASREEIRETILSGRVFRGVSVNRRKSGDPYHEEMTVAPLRDPDGTITHFVSTGHDISGRLLLEEQLRQTQKMEAVGRLAGGVAHDFNNLLTAIIGYSQLLAKRLSGDGAPLRDVEEILKAAERAASLTRRLLAFSRHQVLQPRVLDLNLVVADVDAMLRRIIGADIDLLTLPAPDLGCVRADAAQIEQILLNLAVNARDAMDSGGKITIETANVELDRVHRSGGAEVPPGSYVMLAVSDTGCGMSPEILARIFEPFFTTKEPGKGTGLGLSTVHGIVKQGCGHIEVLSQPDRGTTFKIYLPRIEGAAEDTRRDVTSEEPAGGTETVLVVEDDEQVLRVVGAALRGAGYTILEASNRDEALETLQQCGESEVRIDLMLSDVVMPGMSIRELTDRLPGACRGMRLLYMSGYADKAIVHQRVLEAGIPFIQKPFTLESLLHTIRWVLDAPGRQTEASDVGSAVGTAPAARRERRKDR